MISEKLSVYQIQELDIYLELFIQALTIQFSGLEVCYENKCF